MIDRTALEQIIGQYDKHGWKLRRVLLSDDLRPRLRDAFGDLVDVSVVESTLDALWFSRSSRPESTAWELRHLSSTPYALVVGINEGTDNEHAEALLAAEEAKMIEAVSKRKNGV